MIYVPDDLPYDSCYYLQSNYVLRVYESVPRVNSTVNFVDVALDNHYLYREGTQSFGQYSTIPSCIASDRITNAWSYRTDFFEIIASISIICLFVGFLISRPLKWLIRGWF